MVVEKYCKGSFAVGPLSSYLLACQDARVFLVETRMCGYQRGMCIELNIVGSMVDCWMNGQCLIYIMSFSGAIGCNSHVLMSPLLRISLDFCPHLQTAECG
jgi:hypothetical protein